MGHLSQSGFERVANMRGIGLIGLATALLGACGSQENAEDKAPSAISETPSNSSAPPDAPKRQAGGWDLQSSGEGTALALLSESGRAIIRLTCPTPGNLLLVNVPNFQPIGSEERLSFGSDGEVVALVADARGDRHRGGVSATGEVPANLPSLLGGSMSASYGAQTSGPHPVPPHGLSRAFAAACREASLAAAPGSGD